MRREGVEERMTYAFPAYCRPVHSKRYFIYILFWDKTKLVILIPEAVKKIFLIDFKMHYRCLLLSLFESVALRVSELIINLRLSTNESSIAQSCSEVVI